MTVDKKLAKRGRGGILADQMGLGKTIMTLALIKKYPNLQSIVSDSINYNNHNHITSDNNNNSSHTNANNSIHVDTNSSYQAGDYHLKNAHLSTNHFNPCICMQCIKNKLQLNDNAIIGGTLIILPTSILDQWQLEISSLFGSQLRY
mmetsp:Transcript_49794/g.42003  ORF Transcript_49794/g.42003 Transcript_49794/m.42003 type:complete len:147 (+) Transcript_49794:1151-1591(+)